MNKKLISVPLAALMSIGLAGCGTNDESAAQDGYTDQAQPIGYYSNENHQNRGGNARILDGADNDGPVTEMMDHTLGGETNDRNFVQGDGRFSRTDTNYHAHLGHKSGNARSSYYQAYDGDLNEKIHDTTASVENVESVHSLVYENDVLIAVDFVDNNRKESTLKAIRNAVKPYLKGRSLKIATDQSTFSRLRSIDNDLRDGGPREQIDLDIKNIFRNNNDSK